MLSKISIKNPIFAWMLMFSFILFGGIGFKKLGISQMPDVDFPIINITVNYEGAAVEVMEKDVVDVMEEALISTESLKEIRSSSRRGTATITLEFDLSKNIDVAVQEVQAKIAQAQKKLPETIDPPIIMKSNPEDMPIMYVAVTTDKSTKELSMFIRDYLKDQFQVIPGVGEILLSGYVDRSVRVWLNYDKLIKNEITIDEIMQTIMDQNIEIPGGKFESNKKEFSVKTLGEVNTVDAFNHVFINSRKGAPVYREIELGTLARIEDGLDDIRRISRFNGKPAMGLGIKKIKGSNAVDVAKKIKAKIEELKPKIPQGFYLNIGSDNSKYIEESIEELEFTIILSVILTGIVCRLFLGSFSSTINILISIPTSLIGTFFFVYLAGFTLNTFTLLALTLATGIVVDDAIMVLENIIRHREEGMSIVDASLIGAKEIQFAALVATLAIVAIFLPVAFMSGIIGRYFLEFGVTVSVAVMLSLFEALTFTPMRTSQFLKVSDKDNFIDRSMHQFLDYAKSSYQKILVVSLQFRWTIFMTSIAMFGVSVYFLIPLKKEFIPSQDTGRVMVRIKAPAESSLQYTDSLVQKLEQYALKREELERVFVAVGGLGGGEVNTGILFLTLKSMEKRPISKITNKPIKLNEFMQIIRKDMSQIDPNLKVFIQDLSFRGFSSGRGYPVEFTVTGPDWSVLTKMSIEIRKKMSESKKMVDIDTDYIEGQPELRFQPDRKRAALLGVSISNISNSLGALLSSRKTGKYSENGRSYDIRVGLDPLIPREPKEILNFPIRNNFGEILSLKNLISLSEEITNLSINRVNRQRSVTIYANPAPDVSQQEAIEMSMKIANDLLPEGYGVRLSGTAQTTKESFDSLLFAMLLGILVSYMILASQFNSLKDPLTVLISMPFSFTGAVMALYFFNQSLNVYSFIGFILLLGLVKKNSILLVEFTNHLKAESLTTRDAILTACPLRLRPILMTTISSIAAAIPPALALGPGAETRIPMAISVIGGMIVSTAITLIVVPVMYSLMEKK